MQAEQTPFRTVVRPAEPVRIDSVDASGLPDAFLVELLLRHFSRTGELRLFEISQRLGLSAIRSPSGSGKTYLAEHLVKTLQGQIWVPRDLLNRWIGPLDRHVDYLSLHTCLVFRMTSSARSGTARTIWGRYPVSLPR